LLAFPLGADYVGSKQGLQQIIARPIMFKAMEKAPDNERIAYKSLASFGISNDTLK
jgi:hypothetical protein